MCEMERKKAQTAQRYGDEPLAPRDWAARAHALRPKRFDGGIFLTISLYSPIVVFYSLHDGYGSVAWLLLRVTLFQKERIEKNGDQERVKSLSALYTMHSLVIVLGDALATSARPID